MARTPLGERVARTAIVTPRIRAVDRTVIEDNTAVIFVGEESIADCPQPIHLVERENRQRDLRPTAQRGCCDALCQTPIALHALVGVVIRSEEHTSELQSLMRNSYAVFCLKKKKTKAQQICTTDTIS